jgi:hypothetical protein
MQGTDVRFVRFICLYGFLTTPQHYQAADAIHVGDQARLKSWVGQEAWNKLRAHLLYTTLYNATSYSSFNSNACVITPV